MITANEYQQRIKNLKKLLAKESRHTVALICSAPRSIASYDIDHPYRPDSNLRYVTGSIKEGLLLVIDPLEQKPILYSNKEKLRIPCYETPGEKNAEIAQRINATLVETDSSHSAIVSQLNKYEIVATSLRPETSSWQAVAQALKERRSIFRTSLQGTVALDLFMRELRACKSPAELALHKQAHDVTLQAISEVLSDIKRGSLSEQALRAKVDHGLTREQQTAFESIVATGAHAAILHHHAQPNALLKKNQTVLIDCGAEVQGYAADLTRTIPIGGCFTKQSRALYELAYTALCEARSAVKPGKTCEDIYRIEHRILLKGLHKLKIETSSLTELLKRGTSPYLGWSAGHAVGLDVHEIGNYILGPLKFIPRSLELKAGMLLSIEPGIYLPKEIAGYSPQGVRIEENYVVTNTGSKILGKEYLLDPTEIEETLRQL